MLRVEEMSEERRREIQEIREAHARIAQIVVKGTEYHEPVTVKTVDKKEHSVAVYALSEKDLIEAFQSSGISKTSATPTSSSLI